MKMTLAILIIVFTAVQGSACNCKEKNDVVTEYESVDYVFMGKPLTVDTIYVKALDPKKLLFELNPVPVLEYRVSVIRNFKGTVVRDTLTVYTGMTKEICGVDLRIGGHFIFYGTSETYFGVSQNFPYPQGEKKLWVESCSRTAPKRNLEIHELEKIENPTHNTHSYVKQSFRGRGQK